MSVWLSLAPQFPRPVCLSLFVIQLFVSLPAVSAEKSNPGEEQSALPAAEIEEVVVLGSHIPRADYQSISPVFTIDRADLEMDGRQNLVDLLNRYPQFRPGRNANFVDLVNGTPGRYSLDLRGLGPQRTLTLINGKRLGPSGTDGQVDINILPPGLIERAEILTGGASTAYGSDAMAGVVNLTTRRFVEGMEVQTNFGRTDQGDGDTVDVSLLGGTTFANGRGQVSGFLGYFDADAISRADRDISSEQILEDRRTASLFTAGSFKTPSGWLPRPALLDGEWVGGLSFDASGNPIPASYPESTFNFYPFMDLQHSQNRTTAGVFAGYDLSSTLSLAASLILSQRNSELTAAPTPHDITPLTLNLDSPLFTPTARDVLAQSYDPENTGVIAVPYAYRAMETGPRTRDADQDTIWVNLELQGQWLSEWKWNLAYTLSDADWLLTETGGASKKRLQQAVLVNPETGECFDPTGGCVPADIFGPGRLSAQAAEFLREDAFKTREDNRQRVVSLRTNGQWQVAGLENAVAAGVEWRRDEGSFNPDSRLAAGGLDLGFATQLARSGEDDVAEVYAEVLTPLAAQQRWAETLEVELGLRYSDYSKIGGEWTWKGGLNWAPSHSIRLAGMYQRAARAPNLQESYMAVQEYEYEVYGATVDDPCAASRRPQDVPGRVDICLGQGIAPENMGSYEPAEYAVRTGSNGGNTDLKTEVADTYSLGLIWTPETLDGLSMSLYYYRMEIEDFIFYLDGEDSYTLCYLSTDIDKYCSDIQRAPQGDVTHTVTTFQNLGSIKAAGYDLSLNYKFPHTAPWGWDSMFELSLIANKQEYRKASLGLEEDRDCVGSYGSSCHGVVPEYRSHTRVTYRSGSVTASLSWEWIDSVDSDNALLQESEQYEEAISQVDSHSYLDLYTSWNVTDAVSVSFNVINLSDNSPPLLGAQAFAVNTHPGVYDVLGRRYQAALAFRF